MAKKEKEYTIPKELKKEIIKARALFSLRDIYVKLPFGFKKARKTAIEAEIAKSSFWDNVIELYPNLINKGCSYYYGHIKITKK